MKLGQKLEQLMKASDKTIKQLCKAVGISDPTYYRILESNKTDTDTLRALARELGVDMWLLLDDDVDLPPPIPADTPPSASAIGGTVLQNIQVGRDQRSKQLVQEPSSGYISELSACQQDRERLLAENQSLQARLHDKDLLITAKDQLITLLQATKKE